VSSNEKRLHLIMMSSSVIKSFCRTSVGTVSGYACIQLDMEAIPISGCMVVYIDVVSAVKSFALDGSGPVFLSLRLEFENLIGELGYVELFSSCSSPQF
jgi:hypothetical protein